MLTNSPFYTDEELSEILNDREESIINIIRMNYDKLVNKKYEMQIDKYQLLSVEPL